MCITSSSVTYSIYRTAFPFKIKNVKKLLLDNIEISENAEKHTNYKKNNIRILQNPKLHLCFSKVSKAPLSLKIPKDSSLPKCLSLLTNPLSVSLHLQFLAREVVDT